MPLPSQSEKALDAFVASVIEAKKIPKDTIEEINDYVQDHLRYRPLPIDGKVSPNGKNLILTFTDQVAPVHNCVTGWSLDKPNAAGNLYGELEKLGLDHLSENIEIKSKEKVSFEVNYNADVLNKSYVQDPGTCVKKGWQETAKVTIPLLEADNLKPLLKVIAQAKINAIVEKGDEARAKARRMGQHSSIEPTKQIDRIEQRDIKEMLGAMFALKQR